MPLGSRQWSSQENNLDPQHQEWGSQSFSCEPPEPLPLSTPGNDSNCGGHGILVERSSPKWAGGMARPCERRGRTRDRNCPERLGQRETGRLQFAARPPAAWQR